MKQSVILLSIAALFALAVGCQKYDDTMLRQQLDSQEQRITALETAVAALNARDYVKEVSPIKDGDKILGYKIVFAQTGEITVLNGKDGYSVEVKDDEVIFTVEGGTTFSIPRYAADHFNVPTSIILQSEEFKDVIKKDTLRVDIIVNPSDFPLKKENITLLARHNLYTKYDTTYDDENPQGVETPFDETAHCDLEVVDLAQNTQYEGAYSIAVAVGGEGNFYDDAQVYVLVGGTNHDEKVHYACSNTAFDLYVIPWIEEGLVLDCPQQSFFGLDKAGQHKDSLKVHYATLWSNWYKSQSNDRRYYDRKKLKNIGASESSPLLATDTFDSSKFQEHGILMMTPNLESEFWADALNAYSKEGTVSATIENAAITVTRGNEVKDLPFNYKSFFGIVGEHEVNVSAADIKAAGNKISVDMTADFVAAGDDESFTSIYKMSEARSMGNTGGRFVAQVPDGTKQMDLMFYNPTPTTSPAWSIAIFTKGLASVQLDDAQFTAIPDHYDMIAHRVSVAVNITK